MIQPAQLPAGLNVSGSDGTVVVVNESAEAAQLKAKDGAVMGVPRGARTAVPAAWWRAGSEGSGGFVLTHAKKDVEIVVSSRTEAGSYAGCDAFYRELELASVHDAQRSGAIVAVGVTLAGSLMVGAFVLIRRRAGR